MNFIKAVKLLELDNTLTLKRRNIDFRVTLYKGNLISVAGNVTKFYKSLSKEDVLADDWYVVTKDKPAFEEVLTSRKRKSQIDFIGKFMGSYRDVVKEKPTTPFNYDSDDIAMLYEFMDNYCQWVDEFSKNNYADEILKIVTDFCPEGTFTKEGFYEHHIEKANILLKKSVKYLNMARAIIEKGNVNE